MIRASIYYLNNTLAAAALIALCSAADRFMAYHDLATCETDMECVRACQRNGLPDCDDVLGPVQPSDDDEDDEQPARVVRI